MPQTSKNNTTGSKKGGWSERPKVKRKKSDPHCGQLQREKGKKSHETKKTRAETTGNRTGLGRDQNDTTNTWSTVSKFVPFKEEKGKSKKPGKGQPKKRSKQTKGSKKKKKENRGKPKKRRRESQRGSDITEGNGVEPKGTKPQYPLGV